MKRVSAGLLLFRRRASGVEFLLAHPGGPLWRNKDLGAWTIPKGEYSDDENPLDAARREFEEETGMMPEGGFLPLGELKQPSGKIVTAWAIEGDFAPQELRSNLFTMEWPPKSGKMQEFPEIDRAEWFSLDEARARIIKGQAEFLERFVARHLKTFNRETL